MCIGIPMQVLAMEGCFARCAGPQGEERVDALLTGPLEPGQWVLVFLGAARELIDAGRAAQISAALTALSSLAALEEASPAELEGLIATHFADLVDREPQLPDFLRQGA
jgi:hydrogenase expression/formation protein HypC